MIFATITTMPGREAPLAALQGQLAELGLAAQLFPGQLGGLPEQRANAVAAMRWAAEQGAPEDWLLYLEDDVTLDLDAWRRFVPLLNQAAHALGLSALGLADRRPQVAGAVRWQGYSFLEPVGKPFTDAVLLRLDAIPSILAAAQGSGGSDHLVWSGLARGRRRYTQLAPAIAHDLRLPSILSPDPRRS